ncbi:ABC transporter substrate-binding protein [Cryptosporangium arvum]|uniref:ABC transporter substrate-binding protein n=1 Tax=Cryptosporangium arvum TaxID=80871 RepID=UPI0004B595F8|nr:ABC transporter substrate-binding protein [Cryptosporangium arvum]
MSRARILAVVLALPLLALTACGGSDASAGAGEPSASAAAVNIGPDQKRVRTEKVDTIAKLLPAAIVAEGTLTVGTTGDGTPPLSFRATDDKTVIGVEPDIAQLVADVLGLDLDLQTTSWENLFLSIKTGQYDAGFSNITVTEERKEIYDFATYRVDTLAFEALKSKKLKISGPADVAGLTIGVSPGTNQEEVLRRWDEQNTKAGKKPVKFQYYQKAADFFLALQSGRLDAYLGPNPTLAYHVVTNPLFEIVGNVNGGGTIPAQIAAMTKKGSGLVEAYSAALDEVIRNGKYAEVLKRWGLTNEALPKSEVNPQGLPKS